MSVAIKFRANNNGPPVFDNRTEDAYGSAADLVGSQASAAVDSGLGTTGETVVFAGSGLVFNNTYGSGVSAGFKSAIIAAEAFFQSHFSNSVTLNISFDLAPVSGQIAGRNTFSPIQHVDYATLASALSLHATTPDDQAAVQSLPPGDSTGGAGFAIPVGMARILGLAGAGSGIDDTIVLNQALDWSFGADAIGVLEHEISEGALGRIGGLGVENGWWGPMDLFRYASPAQRDYSGGTDGLASFFSVDGAALLTPFHNSLDTTGIFDTQDFADWASSISGDAFGPSAPGTVSATDLRVLDILGWTPTGAAPSQPDSFTVVDTTTNTTTVAPGDPYVGPVSGLEHQYINITQDSLSITASVPNVFIHSGSGMDGIDVSKANGSNVVDGSTGSNFLIGGTGADSFYMDDREPTSPIFSTIVNFHAGDNATVWGVNASDFTLTTLDNQGAVGAQGLDFVFTAAGHVDTSFVLAGYTRADLLNGRLTESCGTTSNLPGLPGSPYLTLHAN